MQPFASSNEHQAMPFATLDQLLAIEPKLAIQIANERRRG